ncbi:MAG: hypothetical protein LAT55_10945 [Opitutales bacterium]|nr:hypothetical protein [Opitutales bacterium]
MKYPLLIICVFLLIGCGFNPRAAFDRLGFTEDSFLHGRIIDQNGQAEWQSLSKEDIRAIVTEMKRIRPARTAVVEPRFRIALFTDSSEETPNLQIFLDTTGEGYFRTAPGREIMFYSRHAESTMEAITTNPEPEGAGLPPLRGVP